MKHLLFLMAGFTLSLPLMAQQGKETILSGKTVSEDAGKEIEVWQMGSTAPIGNSHNLFIQVKPDGSFSHSFHLEHPGYYNICYNTIHLSPGDCLNAVFSQDPEKSVFTGSEAALNHYLSGCADLHSGCYVGIIGQNNLEQMKLVEHKIDSLATSRRTRLAALKGISPNVRKLEEARIEAEIAGTYFSIPFYRGMEKAEAQQFLSAHQDKLLPILKHINQEDLLEVTVVRDVLTEAIGNPLFTDRVAWTPRLQELYTASTLTYLMQQEADAATLAQVDSFIQGCQQKDIAQELLQMRGKLNKLAKGNTTIDLKLTDATGKEVMLSSFKGKALYIDCWATWCGPCLQQSPAFHALAEKYKNRKDLVFLAVSTDTNRKSWLSFIQKKHSTIPELNCTDTEGMNGWNITSIPRFILIDKDFKIFNANAPLPSSGEKIEEELNELIR